MTAKEEAKTIKRIKIICIFLTAAAILAALSSCGGVKRYAATEFELFDTVTELTGYTESRERFDEVRTALVDLLTELHREFDIYNSYGKGYTANLADVNATAGDEYRSCVVSREIYELLTFGKEVYSKTDGKVNIAMGSVLSLWHECRHADVPRLPDADSLANAAEHTDINDFYIAETKAGYVLTVYDPDLKFDVGAIAKGYAARKAIELLSSLRRDGESFLLNLGGMVCPVGAKPKGEPWQAGIEYPTAAPKDGYLRTVALSEGALVTSSAHLRTFTVNGKSYGHIIDPSTLYPPEYFASVTIYCADPALGDALSTALFCMTETEGRELVDNLDGVGVMWVYPDMKVSSANFFEKFS